MNEVLRSGDVVLPAPVSLTVNDEIIWTSDTGRTLSGYMIGDVLATKKTLSIRWGILTEDELVLIKNTLVAGFMPITFHDDGIDMTIEAYRGTLSKEQLGRLSDGVFYYLSASVDIIER